MKNFAINFNGKTAKYGFYQNVFVVADDLNSAELLGIKKIKEDKKLQAITLNIEEDPPMIYLDSYCEVEEITEREPLSEQGRTYYLEKKWWQFGNDCRLPKFGID
ncbi:hypothetical protein [Desulfoluna spongiiphila]|uniref:hypothetical protein n=1 Tax=Desulfoluna spongiiphila TaxID=419481 RepID=UPI000B851871|nr:hypothetical protein [Desulfoluna spongiiphila]